MDADQQSGAHPPRQLVIGGAIVLTLLYAFRFSTLQLLVDDAFISFRYAETLVQHGELVFNLGERVEGYSNPLWTALLALGIWLGLAPTVVAPALGFGIGLATLALVVWAAHRLLDCSLEVALLAAVVVAMQPAWCFWTGAGLEAPLFALELLTLWVALWSLEKWPGVILVAAIAALLALTRPEGVPFALLVGPALAWRGARPSRIIGAQALVVAVVCAHLAFRLSYYGAWLPNPVVAKAALSFAGVVRGLRYLGSYAIDEGIVWLLPVAFCAPRTKQVATLWALLLGYAAFVIAAGGDGLYRYRLLAHVTPLVALAAVSGATWLLDRAKAYRVALVVGLACNLAMPLALGGFFRGYTLPDVREWEARWRLVGEALAREVPPDTYLATNVVGRVPYYSRLRTLDLLGLTDRTIAAKAVSERGTGYAGHERAAPGYVLDCAPDLIYVSVLDGMPIASLRRLEVVTDVLRRGSLYRYTKLVTDPRFAQQYAPALLPLGDGRTANVFVRRESNSGLQAPPWR